MKRMIFDDISELCDEALEIFDSHDDNEDFCGVSIVGHYDVIVDVLNYLVKNTCFKLYDISLCPSKINGYCDEYILSIDFDGLLWCQEVKRNGCYLGTEKEVIFVHSDVNSKFVVVNQKNNMIEFSFDGEYDDEFCCGSDCKNCELESEDAELTTIDEEDGLHGFTYSSSDGDSYRSVSFYTTENLDNERLKELMGLLEVVNQ